METRELVRRQDTLQGLVQRVSLCGLTDEAEAEVAGVLVEALPGLSPYARELAERALRMLQE